MTAHLLSMLNDALLLPHNSASTLMVVPQRDDISSTTKEGNQYDIMQNKTKQQTQ